MEQQKVGMTALGKIIVFLFIIGCIGGAAYYFRDLIAPSGKTKPTQVDLDQFRSQQGKVEAPDTKGITTVNEYTYVPGDKLPPVKGVSAYKWGADKVVQFPINVWIGWLPIVAANHGFSPNTESVFFKEYGFKVNLKLIDDPVVARDAFASGDSHILWGTLDMIALFAPDLMKDSRTAPRVYQQIDFSAGGDGIVVRGAIAVRQGPQGQGRGLRPEQPVAVLRQQPAAGRRHPTRRGDPQVHGHRVRGGCGLRRRQAHRRLRDLGARHLQHPREGARHPHPHHHGRCQQADRRRVGGPCRLRQGPPGGRQGPGGRDLQGHGPPEGRHLQGQGVPVDGRGLRDAGHRGAGHAERRPPHQLRREQGLLPQPEQPHQLRADVEEHHLRLPRARADRDAGALRRGHGLLGHQAARRRRAPSATSATSRAPASRRPRSGRSRPRRRSSPRPSASTSTPTRPTSSSRSTTSWATRSPAPCTTRT